jgi:bifunctional DNA-binding transcriptional regulator/antitoxin component of YhaV-PrlF toxin-antitoxin module
MDTATVELIKDEVIDKVSKDEAFTAFDITCEMRKKLGNKCPRHGVIKSVVHKVFSEPDVMPGFIRTLIRLNNVPVPPFLYHPEGYDTNLYITAIQTVTNDDDEDDNEDDNDGTATIPSRFAGVKPRLVVKNSDGSYTRGIGKNGYLYVPTYLLRDAGMKHGDTIYIYEASGTIMVSNKDNRNGDSPVASCMVDAKNKVRINKKFLSKDQVHNMALENNEIVIKAV